MSIYVKSHRRGQAIVKAHTRLKRMSGKPYHKIVDKRNLQSRLARAVRKATRLENTKNYSMRGQMSSNFRLERLKLEYGMLKYEMNRVPSRF